ncbi:MAG TPA: BON domain-containing protein [Terriglobales bacterium]|nr:BON domain-containing protein [Terriglobales bacterium]
MKSRSSQYLSVVLFLIMLSIGLGCSKAPNDAQIVSDIQAKINTDSGLQGKQLEVQSANGSVTLSGAVDNDAQRDAAARYASSEPGVKQVINNLQVAPATPPQTAEATPPPPAEQPKPAPSHQRKSRKRQDNSASEPVQEAAQTPPPTVTPVAAPAPVAPPPPPPPQKVTIPQGTALAVRLVDPIDSEKNQVGDTFHATLNNPITINGDTVVPSGSDVQGHLVDVKSAGKFAGQSQVILQLDSITSGGQAYNIQTDQYKKQGSSRGKNTAEKVGAGAGIGALIGALAGGGKGAAIGAAAGGGLGGGVQAATKGQQIKLPSETVLNFTLQSPVTVVANSQGPNAGRQKLDANQ